MQRKCYNFTCPTNANPHRPYCIGFSYYDDDGHYLGISENAELTEVELYDLLKPLLKREEAKNGR